VPPSRRKPEPCAGGRGSGRERSLSLGGAQGYIPSPQVPGREGIHELGSSAQALQHMLEESASLLTMFWRAALPSSPGPALSGSTGQSMKRELLELRTKLSKQESLLQSTVERLKTANQQKESMEQFIFSQLTRTHDVLKKARTNLEAKSGVPGKQKNTYKMASVKPYSCPSKGEVPKGSAVHPSRVTLAFQEPRKKRSRQRSCQQLEGWACPPSVQIPIC